MKTKILILLTSFILPLKCFAQWSNVKNGTSSTVHSLLNDTVSKKLYVGGEFIFADGKQCRGIATWDGLQWNKVENGMDFFNRTDYDTSAFPGVVTTILRYKDAIYACGTFYNAGGTEAFGIAKWDGTKCNNIGNTAIRHHNYDGYIAAMHIYNDELYVSGGFDSIAGIASKCIAKYDGNNWTSLPSPIVEDTTNSWYLSDFTFYKGELYVGGNFEKGTDVTVQDLAKYDGSNWVKVGTSISGQLTDVSKFCVFKNELYFLGYFKKGYGDVANYIAKWDGNAIIDLGFEDNIGLPANMEIIDSVMYVVGSFFSFDNIPNTNRIVKYDGSSWTGFSNQNFASLDLIFSITVVR
jgi:hypothetical protein